MFNLVDTHTDTLFKIIFETKDDFFSENNNLHVDYNNILKSNLMLMTFGIFPEEEKTPAEKLSATTKMISLFYEICKKSQGKLVPALNFNHIFEIKENNDIPVMLSIEGAGFVENDSDVHFLKQSGIRLLAPTWNNENTLGYGSGCDKDLGLKELGRSFLKSCIKNGITLDVSHSTYKGFYDIIEIADNTPIIASHSNVFRLCPNNRNLKDEQIKAIKQCNGVIGITMYTDLIKKNGKCNIDDIIKHIDYICERYGDDYVGIGTDFDGIEILPQGVEGIQSIQKIFERLTQLGYSKSSINKISSANFLRVFNQTWSI